ncbi:50S ribosomal protein L28 [Candidatus Azambacteria bacterium]|nr:50S ribosomal protein L28 [Candidatus Azambacteria bacterium]
MSRKCSVCDKTSKVNTVLVKLRGNYNPTTKRRKYPNLQWTTINGERTKACTKCIRTMNKTIK